MSVIERMPIATYYTKCGICGKKILVQILLMGTNHNACVSTTCGSCLKENGINAQYKKKDPEEAQKIEAWVEDCVFAT